MSQAYKVRPDYLLLFITAALVSIGTLMVWSASPTMAMRTGDAYFYLKRHFMALAVGSTAFYIGFKMNYSMLNDWSNHIIAATLLLLFVVLIPSVGIGAGGANRWLYFGVLSFQPSEIAKIALIIFLASQLSLQTRFSNVISIAASAAAILLIMKEPDMGTALIIAVAAFLMFYLAGAKIKYMTGFVIAGIAGLILASIARPYRIRRLFAYIDPWKDPQNVGFHIIQSLIAVGSGGLFGLGLGGSKQKFFYLPQHYTDFIFAIFCEEMGLFGAIGVIFLFFVFVTRGIRIARHAPDSFSMLLAGGIVAWIGFQAVLNISVVLGILPTTGIPLPFISYGGTSLVMLLFSIGLLFNISQYRSNVGTGLLK